MGSADRTAVIAEEQRAVDHAYDCMELDVLPLVNEGDSNPAPTRRGGLAIGRRGVATVEVS